MADKPTLVRGTIGGCAVQTSKENAERLGSTFTPESKTSAKKAASSKSDSK